MDFQDNKPRTIIDPVHYFNPEKQENFKICTILNGIPCQITCDIVESGTTIGRKGAFNHPYPFFTRVFVIEEGSAEFHSAAESCTLKGGGIYLLPAGKPFIISYSERKLYYFHLNLCDKGGRSLFSRNDPVYSITTAPGLFDLFRKGFETDNGLTKQAALICLLNQIMPEKLQTLREQSELSMEFSLLFQYLDTHPPAQVTIEKLAELYGIGTSALSKRFSRKMRISLKRFLMEKQMAQACEMLLYSSLKIFEIADRLGYQDLQYFYRFFKKHTGQTPGAFRKKHPDSNTVTGLNFPGNRDVHPSGEQL